MRTVTAAGEVALPPRKALALWADPVRWPAFVEGFERVLNLDPLWPAPGAAVVWESIPQGRGRVTERAVEHDPGGRLITEVTEEPHGGGAPRLRGRQELALTERPAPSPSDPGSRAQLWLEYGLGGRSGVFEWLTDALFVRRALTAALERTLDRFAAEAELEARTEAGGTSASASAR